MICVNFGIDSAKTGVRGESGSKRKNEYHAILSHSNIVLGQEFSKGFSNWDQMLRLTAYETGKGSITDGFGDPQQRGTDSFILWRNPWVLDDEKCASAVNSLKTLIDQSLEGKRMSAAVLKHSSDSDVNILVISFHGRTAGDVRNKLEAIGKLLSKACEVCCSMNLVTVIGGDFNVNQAQIQQSFQGVFFGSGVFGRIVAPSSSSDNRQIDYFIYLEPIMTQWTALHLLPRNVPWPELGGIPSTYMHSHQPVWLSYTIAKKNDIVFTAKNIYGQCEADTESLQKHIEKYYLFVKEVDFFREAFWKVLDRPLEEIQSSMDRLKDETSATLDRIEQYVKQSAGTQFQQKRARTCLHEICSTGQERNIAETSRNGRVEKDIQLDTQVKTQEDNSFKYILIGAQRADKTWVSENEVEWKKVSTEWEDFKEQCRKKYGKGIMVFMPMVSFNPLEHVMAKICEEMTKLSMSSSLQESLKLWLEVDTLLLVSSPHIKDWLLVFKHDHPCGSVSERASWEKIITYHHLPLNIFCMDKSM